MADKQHWETVYATKPATGVSWFQPHAEQSLRLVRGTGAPRSASIIDVGGGASTLVDDLLADGYTALTALDLSGAALEVARQRLGERAAAVRWIESDILAAPLPRHAFDVWHAPSFASILALGAMLFVVFGVWIAIAHSKP